jgi:multidrug transporter EmrE-like cation transporter
MLTGLIFLIITGSIWVVQGGFISDASKKSLNMPYILGMLSFLGIIITIPAGIIWKVDLPLPFLIALPLAGVFNYLSFLFMNKAMRIGPNGIVWAIVQSAFSLPFLMGILFFHVESTFVRIAGLLMLLTSMVIFGTTGKNDPSAETEGTKKWLIFALTAYFLVGTTQSLTNLPSYFVKDVEGGLPATLFRTGLIAVGTIFTWLIHGVADRKCFDGKGCFLHAAFLGYSGTIASVLAFFGLDRLAQRGAGAIGYPVVAGIAISVFMIYTAIRLKEKMSFPVLCGLLFCLAGIIVISL